MKSIHAEVKGAYGSPRMHRELHGRRHRIGLRTVERLMREHGIRARQERRFKATTDSTHSMPRSRRIRGRATSRSRKGDCWDKAPTESFFNSLKNERVHGTPYATRADAQADLFEYIDVFYNRSRRHSMLGHLSPLRFLQDWISEHVDQQSKAA